MSKGDLESLLLSSHSPSSSSSTPPPPPPLPLVSSKNFRFFRFLLPRPMSCCCCCDSPACSTRNSCRDSAFSRSHPYKKVEWHILAIKNFEDFFYLSACPVVNNKYIFVKISSTHKHKTPFFSADQCKKCFSRNQCYAVLRIHDILGWIRIRGSMPLTNGSGSGSWIRILLFSSLNFKMPAKNKFFNTIFSAYYFLKLHIHHFSKIKSQKESQYSKN